MKNMERIKKEYDCLLNTTNHKFNTNKGLNIVNYFTLEERLNTRGNKGISFREFERDWNEKYSLSECNQKMYDWYNLNKPLYGHEKILMNIFRLYYGMPMTMKPIRALELFREFRPKRILDPCAGFGSRMLSANIYGAESYIGIDSNINLIEPIKEMINWLSDKSKTNNQMYWESALTMDYTKLNYDFVFTSPPYYNIERYNHMIEYKTKLEWDNKFYIPLWTMVWDSLKSGGHFCVNVNREIYIRTLVPLFGNAEQMRTMTTRHKFKDYQEMIYIWKKD